mgnify:FL=1
MLSAPHLINSMFVIFSPYLNSYPRFVLFAGETQFNADAIRQLQVHSVTDNSTYAYQFSNLFHSDDGFLNYPSWAKTSADHGEELPFVWGMLLEKEQYQNLTKGGFKFCNLCKYSSKAWQQILTRNVTPLFIVKTCIYSEIVSSIFHLQHISEQWTNPLPMLKLSRACPQSSNHWQRQW